MPSLNWKVMTWSLGVFSAITFILYVAYGLLVPRTFYMVQVLEITLPGLRRLSVGSFVLGLVESFLHGAYAGLVLAHFVARRCGGTRPPVRSRAMDCAPATDGSP